LPAASRAELWRLETLPQLQAISFSILDPGVIFEDMTMSDHVGETYRGHDGVVRALVRWIEHFQWMLIDLEQVVDAGDCVISVHRCRAKARDTGIEFKDRPLSYLWTFRDGKVVHFWAFRDSEQAIQAAGLRESAMSQEAHEHPLPGESPSP
jgi:ketosteroid isomerase-like protein